MPKKQKIRLSPKTADEIRHLILKFLYEKRKKARSLKTMGVTPRELKEGLKELGFFRSNYNIVRDKIFKRR